MRAKVAKLCQTGASQRQQNPHPTSNKPSHADALLARELAAHTHITTGLTMRCFWIIHMDV